VAEKLNFKGILPDFRSFNLPLANYQAGSYFGDSDFFSTTKTRHFFRAQTMVCDADCNMYIINAFALLDILADYKQIYSTMKKVSDQKQKYYARLLDALAQKYNDKFKVVGLYNELKDFGFTSHQGHKRRKNKI
tara:strand:+ start:692 stop:1093 length:402 start_codon:yes stop_codon:yes gene_type:complete